MNVYQLDEDLAPCIEITPLVGRSLWASLELAGKGQSRIE
jgi:hypothetical protein